MEQRVEPSVGLLLKNYRRRISSEQESLGAYTRIPVRLGKPVTQEEVAEALGISREWYGMLENGRSPSVSSRLVSQLADVLMLDSGERAELLRVARPELRPILQDRSLEMLDAFTDVRRAARRLWTATTESEALQFAREFLVTRVTPLLVVSAMRGSDGHWDQSMTGEDREVVRHRRLIDTISDRWGDSVIDELFCYEAMEEPGELLTRVERNRRFPDVAVKDGPVLHEVGWAESSLALVNVRSRRGLAARLNVRHHGPHDFSDVERAELSTLGELTSLALS